MLTHRSAAVILILLCFAGCGEALHDVSGSVMIGQEKIVPQPPRTVQVTLRPVQAADESPGALSVELDPEGNFELTGVRPGRYQVDVYDAPGPQATNRLAKHFSALESPIEIEISDSSPLAITLPAEWAE